jgi:hypothetical protein
MTLTSAGREFLDARVEFEVQPFHVRNAPLDTHRLSFTLFRSHAEHGGDQTPYPASGDVPAGLIYTNGRARRETTAPAEFTFV